VATNSAQGFSISECGTAAFQTGVGFSSRFMDRSGVHSELAVRFQDVRGLRRPWRGRGRLDLAGEPVPSVRKAQKRKAQTLLPVSGCFHLAGEGPALIGTLAVL
jgi:hypothetical protein